MSINNEDKKDVAKHMGKALANKVSKVTKDSRKVPVRSISDRTHKFYTKNYSVAGNDETKEGKKNF